MTSYSIVDISGKVNLLVLMLVAVTILEYQPEKLQGSVSKRKIKIFQLDLGLILELNQWLTRFLNLHSDQNTPKDEGEMG